MLFCSGLQAALDEARRKAADAEAELRRLRDQVCVLSYAQNTACIKQQSPSIPSSVEVHQAIGPHRSGCFEVGEMGACVPWCCCACICGLGCPRPVAAQLAAARASTPVKGMRTAATRCTSWPSCNHGTLHLCCHCAAACTLFKPLKPYDLKSEAYQCGAQVSDQERRVADAERRAGDAETRTHDMEARLREADTRLREMDAKVCTLCDIFLCLSMWALFDSCSVAGMCASATENGVIPAYTSDMCSRARARGIACTCIAHLAWVIDAFCCCACLCACLCECVCALSALALGTGASSRPCSSDN